MRSRPRVTLSRKLRWVDGDAMRIGDVLRPQSEPYAVLFCGKVYRIPVGTRVEIDKRGLIIVTETTTDTVH